MNRLTSFVAVAAMAVGGVAFMGCESANQSDQTSNDRPGFAGGNGEFGESPEQAGVYTSPSPTTAPEAPATQPAPDAGAP